MKWAFREGCDFCCYEERDGKRHRRYGKEEAGYKFYAGYSKQVDVDRFDDCEVDQLRYCPKCARKLVG